MIGMPISPGAFVLRMAALLRLGLPLLAAGALAGCVAAIPLAATGMIAKGSSEEGDDGAALARADARDIPLAPAAYGNANRTEQYVAVAMFAADNAKSGLSVIPDPAAGDDTATVRPCDGQAPAILVDLDPGDAAFDPANPDLRAQPGLASALSIARGSGVAVVWTSVLDENREGAVRGALRQSGLDPAGRDVLLLTRDPAESKTERRNAAAGDYCIKAIVGDRRGDFDTLLEYLRDPSAATPFDALFGQGWFELPPPIDYAA